MSKLRSRLPPSFSVTVGMNATAGQFTSLMFQVLARAAVLAPTDFFAGLRKGVKAALPPAMRDFSIMRGHSRLLKIHYGEPNLHFEAWHHTGDGRLEVGLHFEGTAQQNERAFAFFRDHMVEVKAALRRAELEPLDRGRARVYGALPVPVLHQRRQDSVVRLV